jgi:LAO/AO transport system kinase
MMHVRWGVRSAVPCTRFFSAASTNFSDGLTKKNLSLADRLLSNNRTALAQAITLVESTAPRHRAQAELLLNYVTAKRRESSPPGAPLASFRLGIAGPPGAGKSTFIEAMGTYLTGIGHRVAVVAIDPSSSISGGSILGDKTRMAELAHNKDAFVRPSPTRGTLGGVSENTNDVVLLCESANFDIVIVETVGLGQSEITVCDTTDMLMLLVPPAAGDELQGVKKGIMEVADMVVVNKADGALKTLAKNAANEYKHAMQLLRRRCEHWKPSVKLCSALHQERIDDVWSEVMKYKKTMDDAGDLLAAKRGSQSQEWVWNQLQTLLIHSIRRDPALKDSLADMEQALVNGLMTPRQAARELLELYRTASPTE